MFSDVCVRNQKNANRTSSNQVVRRLLMMSIAAAMLCQTVGCANKIGRIGIIDELAVSYRDAVWAKRAYNLRFANCDRPYGDHFENGFCEGYSDVSNGGDGYVPALPPDDYRGYEFQSADGAQCIASWFEGYPAGVAAAKQDRHGKYHDIFVSRMIDSAVTQSKAKHVLPSDVPVMNSTASALRKPTRMAPPVPPITRPARSVFKLPPIVPVAMAPMPKSTPAVSVISTTPSNVSLSPLVKSNVSIDPTAGVTRNETPLPMAVRSATWESNRRQTK